MYIAADSALSNIYIADNVNLSPSFQSSITSYSATVDNSNTTINLTLFVRFTGATVTVNDVSLPSGSTSPDFNLTVGTNSFTIVVTAEDGFTTSSYIVSVTRLACKHTHTHIHTYTHTHIHIYTYTHTHI